MLFSFQIVVDYSEYIDEADSERLKFLLVKMETEMVMRNWDLRVSASVGSAQIQDYISIGE